MISVDKREIIARPDQRRMTSSARSLDHSAQSRLRRLAARLPRPLRFMAVGGLGLSTDIILFTVLLMFGVHTLLAGLFAKLIATVLTWRLNRAFTFDRSGRSQHEEAMRYAIVTATAQSTSYAVFAGLVLTVLAPLPQAAIVAGAAVGALISYNGHRLFAFAPRKTAPHKTAPRAVERKPEPGLFRA